MKIEHFSKFYKGNDDAVKAYLYIYYALNELGILDELTLIGALATVRVEVGRKFKPIEEIASGQAYEGRKDLGNTVKGDGMRFKGRGYIQVTGRANYANYGNLINVDLVKNPELALDPLFSAKILAHYFKERKVHSACRLQDWTQVRKLINGGSNGLKEFLSIVEQYKKS